MRTETKRIDTRINHHSKIEIARESALVELLTRPERNSATRLEYAKFLQDYIWDDMITITFRSPRKEPYYAAKYVWRELQENGAMRAFLGVEPFQSGDLHVHGLISSFYFRYNEENAFTGGSMSLPWEMWSALFKKFGRSKVTACRSPEAVSLYCSKYILKQQNRVADFYYLYGDKGCWQKTSQIEINKN